MQFMRGRFDLAAPRIRYRVERACISFGSSVSLILQPAKLIYEILPRGGTWIDELEKEEGRSLMLGILEMYDFFRKYLKRNE